MIALNVQTENCHFTADNNSESGSHSNVGDMVSFHRLETPDNHVTKVRIL